ncbi:MAG: hypothetical protein ACPGVG_10820 [Mycobacterium sp.]
MTAGPDPKSIEGQQHQQPRTLREKIRGALRVSPEHREPSDYERAILYGLQFKSTYQGTVDPVTVAERRRRNRCARRSRRINRRAAER